LRFVVTDLPSQNWANSIKLQIWKEKQQVEEGPVDLPSPWSGNRIRQNESPLPVDCAVGSAAR
jgi:hypothetical protein